MKTQKTITFDMDGTIANLYGVKNWLDFLLVGDETPYREAEIMYDPSELIGILYQLKEIGYQLIVVSWLAKNSTKEYDTKVRQAKREWLKEYELYNLFDHVRIAPYGTNKSTITKRYSHNAILVDDEQKNLNDWKLGGTINANENIIAELKKLLG